MVVVFVCVCVGVVVYVVLGRIVGWLIFVLLFCFLQSSRGKMCRFHIISVQLYFGFVKSKWIRESVCGYC